MRLVKLLYFDVPTALDKEDLSEEEIDELFYGKEIKNEDGSMTLINKRIFNQMSSPDILTNMSSQIRIYPDFTQQNNLTKITLFFEVIVNINLNQLNDGFMRDVEITKEIHKSLKNCNAIGKINFNNDFVKQVYFGAKSYYGYMFTGTTRLNSKWGE